MDWADVPTIINDWAERLACKAYAIKQASVLVPAREHVGYYVNPHTGLVALYGAGPDLALCKEAVERAVGPSLVRGDVLSLDEIGDAPWVKVAYSHTLRRLGEYLNFFPGQYPGGIPNSPSPMAAMLTSSLVGAGLGYGGGRLAENLLPEGYGKRLRRTGAIVGGLAGGALAAPWMYSNLAEGRSVLDPHPLHQGPEEMPEPDSRWLDGTNMAPPPPEQAPLLSPEAQAYFDRVQRQAGRRAINYFKTSSDTYADFAPHRVRTPSDVNINHLGQTLWDMGASTALTGAAMNTLYAAQQLPDPESSPGVVTGNQLGMLAANAVGDYGRGIAAGALINAVIGTPYSAPALGMGVAGLGLLRSTFSNLFR